MKRTLISLAITLAFILGLTTVVNANYISFYDERGGTKIDYMEHVHNGDTLIEGPTRTGYDFTGWASDNEDVSVDSANVLSVPWEAGDSRNSTPLDIYATWGLSEYQIMYVLNGGTASDNPSTYTIESEDITLNNPTREGYEFVGWMDEEDNELGTEVTIPSGSTGDRIFIARWNAIPYNVTYVLDGGTAEDNPETYTADDSFTLNNPTKEGFEFKGWTDENGTDLGTEVTVPEGSTGDKTFIAKWEEVVVEEKTTNNPPTSDNVVLYVALLSVGLVGVITTKKILKK